MSDTEIVTGLLGRFIIVKKSSLVAFVVCLFSSVLILKDGFGSSLMDFLLT